MANEAKYDVLPVDGFELLSLGLYLGLDDPIVLPEALDISLQFLKLLLEKQPIMFVLMNIILDNILNLLLELLLFFINLPFIFL